jgi:hypothetical protein
VYKPSGEVCVLCRCLSLQVSPHILASATACSRSKPLFNIFVSFGELSSVALLGQYLQDTRKFIAATTSCIEGRLFAFSWRHKIATSTAFFKTDSENWPLITGSANCTNFERSFNIGRAYKQGVRINSDN